MLYNGRGEKMRQKWGKMQFVEISMHEIFCFQDKLDRVKDNPEQVWEVVDEFFMECENQLELDPGFIKEMQELDLEEDFVPLDIPTEDDIEYVSMSGERRKLDIPFVPRHNF